ncbi:hypothetical protein [Streptomyces sp. NPDC005438]|uniref:hypothetical protein n=1 Tax=Streptomyces sp. NPDC005438 TaxID=3156880 RepID=UPI0033BE9995
MTDTFTRWDARLRLELAARSVDRATADTVLEEVTQHCAESGETPEEAFGTPEEYADLVATERIPTEVRAGRDRDGSTRADDVFAAFTVTGVMAVLAGGYLWLDGGLTRTVTTAGLVGTLCLAVALVTGSLAYTVSRHRDRAALWWGLGALVATVLAATAFTTLPTGGWGRFPAPVLCLVGVLTIWLTARYEPGSRPGGEPATEEPATDEAWLERLSTLLRRRHALPSSRAAALVQDAARHLEASGTPAREEFGPVESYALRLADQERAPRTPWWLRSAVQETVIAVILAGYLAHNIVSDGPLWLILLTGGALALDVVPLVLGLLGRRSAHRAG